VKVAKITLQGGPISDELLSAVVKLFSTEDFTTEVVVKHIVVGLSDQTREVLKYAEEEARGFKHNYIGTEHLLLGLIREEESVAAKVLQSMGVELNKVRSAVEFIIGRGDRLVQGEIAFTPRSKKVLELALDEARQLNHEYVGPEHILLGLIREGGIAAGVFESLGVHLEKARNAVLKGVST